MQISSGSLRGMLFCLLAGVCFTSACQSRAFEASPTPSGTPAATELPTITATRTLTPSLSPTRTATPTVTQTPLPTHTPGPTLLPPDDVLRLYPLAEGQERVYQVSIAYAVDFNEDDQFVYEVWEGLVHEYVILKSESHDSIIFELHYPDYPSFRAFEGVEVGEYTKTIEIKPGGVYLSGEPRLIFPLQPGNEWLAFGPDFPEYKWKTDDEIYGLSTPAGDFSNCYRIALYTFPDHTIVTFCPGVGIVKKTAAHHPPSWMFTWELIQLPDN